jgi:Flp pilus assembly pilin Flp
VINLKAVWSRLVSLGREEDAQDLLEYSLLLAFVALATFGILTSVSVNISSVWSNVNSGLTAAVSAVS